MSAPKLCRAPKCGKRATKGAYWWKTEATDRFVWTTFCTDHAIVALTKGAGYMARRPGSKARAKREKGEGK